MALLALIYSYLKFFFTVPRLALKKYAPAYCVRSIQDLLFVPTVWTFHFQLSNLPPPAIRINACFICFKKISRSFSDTCCAFRFLHSLRIRRCSFVKCFSVSLSSSVLIVTMRARTVLGPSPVSICLNSSQGIVSISLESRIPYSDWKEATIRS